MHKMDANALPMPNVSPAVINKSRIRKWFHDRAVDMGYIEMNDSQPKPAGYNATMILCTLMIIAVMIGLVYFTYQLAYRQAEQDIKNRSLEKRVEESEAAVKRAERLSIYNNGAHEEGNKEKK